MTTAEKIIIALLIVGLVIVSFVAFGGNKKTIPVIDPGTGVVVNCNPLDPGFDINGIQNPLCGRPKCDPTRPGFNLDGFLDVDCGGAGRIRR